MSAFSDRSFESQEEYDMMSLGDFKSAFSDLKLLTVKDDGMRKAFQIRHSNLTDQEWSDEVAINARWIILKNSEGLYCLDIVHELVSVDENYERVIGNFKKHVRKYDQTAEITDIGETNIYQQILGYACVLKPYLPKEKYSTLTRQQAEEQFAAFLIQNPVDDAARFAEAKEGLVNTLQNDIYNVNAYLPYNNG